MNRLSTLIVAIALPLAFAAPALAQEGKTLGTVVNGNNDDDVQSRRYPRHRHGEA